ncbi:unnamed protein product [Caenorhabditis auriculariae]|uniref:Uncharacterized protein n=1 Tax=Caenorhabditis auriculariae TaxID=2777116 RepID=A0A8S1H3M3_9PELO|nr:unnamed protein product [Caenorhabditis auriculariae]
MDVEKVLPTVLGIDFGTTNTVGAFQKVRGTKNHEVIVRHNDTITTDDHKDSRLLPSQAYILEDGETRVGTHAKEQCARSSLPTTSTFHPENRVYANKRMLGRRLESVIPFASKVEYNIVEKPDEPCKLPYILATVNDPSKSYISPVHIAAKIIKKVVAATNIALADNITNEKVQYAVITTPAYFSGAQRRSTRFAGELAGLKVLAILDEPTAAAIGYSFFCPQTKGPQTILVHDMGGGTFDVSIVELKDGEVRVLAIAGENYLGGEDFVEAMMIYLVSEWRHLPPFKSIKEIYYQKNVLSLLPRNTRVILRNKCEFWKREAVNHICHSKTGRPPKAVLEKFPNYGVELNREVMRKICTQTNIVNTKKFVDEALRKAGKTAEDIDKVLLVGGSYMLEKMKNCLEMESSIFYAVAVHAMLRTSH